MADFRMPWLDHKYCQPWKNWHANISIPNVADQASFRRGDIASYSLPGAWSETAAALKEHIQNAVNSRSGCGVLGSAWSWSKLVGMAGAQLETEELDQIDWVQPEHMHVASSYGIGRGLVFVGGGAKGSKLIDFLEPQGFSIRTCGSYLGQSIAGSLATGVNGSRLGYGGFQDQVVGLHIVTAPDASVWVERASRPVLNDSTALGFAERIIRDDAVFEDALVHLGAMGIVNGVVFEAVPKIGFRRWRGKRHIDPQWLDLCQQGNFKAIARSFGKAFDPVYYEAQIDPFAPFESPALHTFYYEAAPSTEDEPFVRAVPQRVIDGLVAYVARSARSAMTDPGNGGGAPPVPEDIFKFYSDCYFVETDETKPLPLYTWGGLHCEPPAAELREIVYSAAIAFDRSKFVSAVSAATTALQEQLSQQPVPFRHMIYTFRFVTDAAGTMAFTRFPESVVLDMEGLIGSPLSFLSGDNTCRALNSSGVSYTNHWGKLTPLSTVNIEREFGPRDQPGTRLHRWLKTRKTLLPPESRKIFWSVALREWGLLSEAAD